MRTVLAHTFAGVALIALSAMAQAQSVTPAQQDAIRTNCRSDFMANCSSVPRGGREAFMCLEQNKAKLSSGCKSAVDAVAAASAPKPAAPPVEAKPQAAPTPAAATPAAVSPTVTEKPAPVATAPAAPSTTKPATKPVPAPRAAAAPVRPAAPSPAAPAAPAEVLTPEAAPIRQPTLGEAMVIRRFCANDYRVLCKSTQIGGGRAIKCLADNGPALSPGCKAAMAKAGN